MPELMRQKRVIAGLGLLVACARPPSAVPLGGSEWIAPERHVDRRARTSESPSSPKLPPQRTSQPSPPVKAAKATATVEPKSAPSGDARESQFGLVPLAQGARVLLNTKYTVRATLVSADDGAPQRQSVEVDSAERIAVTIVRASDDGAREVEVEYLESHAAFRMEGSPDEEESNAGKRYTVTLDAGGGRVTPKSGSLEAGEEHGVLIDLGTVTGYFPLVKPHLPRALAPGFSMRPGSGDVARVFGAPPDAQFEGAELSLRGPAPGDASAAFFDCKLPVSFVKDGVALRASLSGTASVRMSDARPLVIALRGPISSETGALGPGSSLSGSIAIELSHEYPTSN